MTRLIGLWGYAGSGKDTAAESLIADGWRREAFADRMRAMLYVLNPIVWQGDGETWRLREAVGEAGWDELKRDIPEVRELLQRLGTEAGRAVLGESVWVTPVIDAAQGRAAHEGLSTVVTDVRFRNEAEAIKAAGGIVVAIVRPGCGPVNGHASETALADWPFDFTIHNDRDIEHLHEVIRAIAGGPGSRAVPSVHKAPTEEKV